MKLVFCLSIFFIPIQLFSQKWEFKNMGNSFDGFKKIAAVQIKLEDENYALLAVKNESEEHNLIYGINKKNGIDKLSLVCLIPNDVSPQNVLMAFDDENKYYVLNFDLSDNQIYIENAITPDYKSFYTVLDIISFFKLKKTLHIRLVIDDSKLDYSFPLGGSTAAISKTFSCPSYKRSNNYNDAIFEIMSFELKMRDIGYDKINLLSAAPNCLEYLSDNYGRYFFTQIKTIESKVDGELPTLVFKNRQNEIVAEITKDIYLRNLFHFSGNPKRVDGKLSKDMETIIQYFNAFDMYSILPANNDITLEKFANLSKKELMPYFKAIKTNKELLDYLRINENVFYSYEVKDYTFEVFAEAWGE